MPCCECPISEPFHFFHFSSQVVLQKHVDLVDLVQGSRENIQIFKSEEELSNYTHETEKFFPKERAKDGGVLRALRRHILEPRESPSSQGQWPQPGNSYHHRLVESIQFEGSNSFQELRSGGTWGLGPVLPLPYHPRHMPSSSTCPSPKYVTLVFQPSYPALPLPALQPVPRLT